MLIEEGAFPFIRDVATAYEVAIDIESKKVDPGIGIDKILMRWNAQDTPGRTT
jgi:hypothetical protein